VEKKIEKQRVRNLEKNNYLIIFLRRKTWWGQGAGQREGNFREKRRQTRKEKTGEVAL